MPRPLRPAASRSVIESLVSDLAGMDLTVDQLVDVGLPLLLPTPEEGGTPVL